MGLSGEDNPRSREVIHLVEPWLPPDAATAVHDQVASGWIGPGPATRAFGEALQTRLGVNHSLLTCSGTVALSIAARGLGLVPGDEVLVPAYGVVATINAFASIGLRPRLVDIDRHTGCMDPEALAEALTPRPAAVCFVNFSGRTGDELEQVVRLCADAGVPLIEDAACALGQRRNGRAAGTFGTVGTLSFSVPKVLTTGQGGAVLTDESSIWERAAAHIDQGDLHWRKTQRVHAVGTNLRFTDIQAALGAFQLQDLDGRLTRRRDSYRAMQGVLGNRLFAIPGDEAPLHNIVLSPEADRLVEHLRGEGIRAARQYCTVSEHPAYAELADRPYPNADHWSRQAVYLPFGLTLTPNKAVRVAEAVLGANLPVNEVTP